MKIIATFLIAAALCCTLTACADAEPSTAQPQIMPTVAANSDEMYIAYRTALDDLMTSHTLPDGTECAFDPSYSDISENQFAVYDIDMDGSDELLIYYSSGAIASMSGSVWAYDSASKTLRAELKEYPALTFYLNGAVKADWSHNQGLAGDFWPYTLYQYDRATDQYLETAMVDAWDKSIVDTDYPSDTDVSGTGVVYYIMTGGEYDKSNPLDVTEYDAWLASVVGDSAAVELHLSALTAENILHVGM